MGLVRGRGLGIIPAYAGSTSRVCPSRRLSGDHPRIRGEHDRIASESTLDGGSSPHTRGAHPVGLVRGRGLGIIPAYAGSTSPTASAADWAYGSSPHTRGARRRRRGRSAATRIIPAYAGSTLRADRFCACRRDHPRIRGEHGDAFMLTVGGWGSSPHTRGAQSAPGHRQGIRRIIPAYAGSTRAYCQELPKSGDHPRIRGEHSTVPIALIATAGSSPHTRGAPNGMNSSLCRGLDHPRIRGEHGLCDMGPMAAPGSSPHTRGAPANRLGSHQDGRIIPAYAGSPRRP